MIKENLVKFRKFMERNKLEKIKVVLSHYENEEMEYDEIEFVPVNYIAKNEDFNKYLKNSEEDKKLYDKILEFKKRNFVMKDRYNVDMVEVLHSIKKDVLEKELIDNNISFSEVLEIYDEDTL